MLWRRRHERLSSPKHVPYFSNDQFVANLVRKLFSNFNTQSKISKIDKATNTDKHQKKRHAVTSTTSLETAVEFLGLLEKKAATKLDVSEEEAAYLEVIGSYSPNDSVLSSKYLKLEAERDESQVFREFEASRFKYSRVARKASSKEVVSLKLNNGERKRLATKPGGIVDNIKQKVLSCTKQQNTGKFLNYCLLCW